MSIIIGRKVGTTIITSSYTDGVTQQDSAELEVTAVSLESISKPDDTTYTGSEIEPGVIVKATVGGVLTELEYGTDYTLSYTNNIDTGIATVTATGVGNFTGTVYTTWNITDASMTVTANDQSYTYDGSLHGSPITVSTVNNQEATIRYRFGDSGDYTLTSTPQIKNVIDSGIVYFQVTAPNHETYTGSYRLDVYPKVATLTWGTLNWVYDGHEHHTTCTVNNLVSGDTCNVILSGNSITNMGSTTVYAYAGSALDNPNYMLSETQSRVLTVSPGLYVMLSDNWTPVKKVYKKISGAWVEQNMTTAFSEQEKYVKID